MIAAKSYAALRDMNEIIRTDLLKKEYYTITVGIPQSGRFTAWWEHDEKNNKVSIHAHQAQDEHRKQIITDVDVLRTAGPFALCKIGLVTGRTHQIRAHLAYLGKPVLGDIKYGNRKMNEAHRHQNAGPVRRAHHLPGNSGGKHPARSFRQGHQLRTRRS